MWVTTIMHGEAPASFGCFDLAVPPHVQLCGERKKNVCVADAAKVEINTIQVQSVFWHFPNPTSTSICDMERK